MSAAIGVTVFAALVWGAVLLVVAVFTYVARTLVADRRNGPSEGTTGSQ